jgi:hypothetical protein
MSFNQLIKNSKNLDILLFKELLSDKKGEYLGARTLREQSSIESELISPEIMEENLLSSIKFPSAFSQVHNDQFSSVQESLTFLHKKCMLFESQIKLGIKSRINNIEAKKIEVAGKVSELRQKLNSLSGFSEGYKFVIKEDFYNLYSISRELVTKKELNIDLESNCATLPIVRSEKVTINKIVISNQSKGIPGNYLSGKNKLIYSTVDENDNTFFEFFKLDAGPVKLVLNLRFSSSTIVNQIRIKKAFASASSSFKVSDVIFNKNKHRSIKKLCDMQEQSFEINAASKNGELVINHLPIEADSATIYLESNEYTTVKNGRKIFILGLKQVEFHSIQYDSEGQFGSSRIVTPENLFLLSSETKIFPKRNGSYNEELSVSVDNGAKRHSLAYIENKTKDLILDGRQNFFNYIYNLKRNENIVSKLENYSRDTYFVKTNSSLQTVNKKLSPISYPLNYDAAESELQVVQSKVLVRDDLKEKALTIGRVSNSGVNRLYIPISLKSLRIGIDQVKIYLNNKQTDVIESETDSESNVYLNYDENYIEVFLAQNKTVKVKILLIPFDGKVILKQEGYYVEIPEPFEYDKRLIKVKTTVSSSEVFTQLVPRGTELFFLPHENVEIVDVEYEKADKWANACELNLSNQDPDCYEIHTLKSSEAGIISFKEETKAEQLRVNYKIEKKKQLTEDEFEIWGKDRGIKGVYLYPEAVSFNDAQKDIVTSSKVCELGVTDIVEGSLSFKTNPWDDSLYKEVDFIDGYSEFLQVEKMKKDYVPRIEWSDITDDIKFTISQIPYLAGSYENSMKVYQDGEVKENTLALDGASPIVYNLSKIAGDPSSHAEGYYLEYFYLKEEPDTHKKFSVDYEKGIVYFSEETTVLTSLNFKYGDIEISYNIYNNIKNYLFDKVSGVVKVHTEEFVDQNNDVRFLWYENEKEFNLEGLENYYSPIVYGLKVGMN